VLRNKGYQSHIRVSDVVLKQGNLDTRLTSARLVV
jgi:hypothetical protein